MYYDQLINYDQFINLGNNIQKEEFVNLSKLGKKFVDIGKKTVPKVTNVVKKSAPKVTNVAKKGAGAIGTGATYAATSAAKNPKTAAAVTAGVLAGTYAVAESGALGEDVKAIADNIEDKVGNAAKETANVVKKTANTAGDLVGDALWSFFKPFLVYGSVFFIFLCAVYFLIYMYNKQYAYAAIPFMFGSGCGVGLFFLNKHKDS